jgi:PhnB protein
MASAKPTSVKPIPDGYHRLQPYLIFRNCAGAIEFYKKVLGATERLRMPRPDGSIGHAEIMLGDSCIMMADEHPEIGAYAPEHYGGCPVRMQFYTEDCDAVYKKALSEGAKSEREPKDQFYGDRNAGFVDPFGYLWYVSTCIKNVSKEELEKAQ